ncbi:unnamed protein product [Sphagnum troendelagicum]|uniref:X8 domain-containing protein n=1 Tax=Sphagnum troendelagicum TaxID=128251 RepID=A0ABP0UII7_9BRYO
MNKISRLVVLMLLLVCLGVLQQEEENVGRAGATILGVNWGTVAFNPLPNSIVVKMLQANNITKVKLFDANPQVIKSMAGTNIEVMVAATNDELASLASSPAAAAAWVQENVTQYIGGNGVNIKWVAVGNEPFLNGYNGMFQNVALPALQNVQKALAQAGHASDIKATIPCNADVLSSPPPYLPSQTTFRPDISSLMIQISQFLASTGAPFMVNFYPFLSLVLSTNFPLAFAFFNGSANSITDGPHVYTNVFDASYDGLVTALTNSGFPTMPIIVGEIGWPTDGVANANLQFAQSFMSELVKHMLSGTGTPLRPGVLDGYLFSLLDEDAKSILPGPFERHWGIFNYDGSLKYTLDLTGGTNGGTSTNLISATNVPYLPTQWCVVNQNADLTQLQANVDYACNHGDCTASFPGGSCSTLTVQANASYAFNNYYQFTDQASGTCNFQGLAKVTTTNPTTGTCQFLIGLQPTAVLSSSTSDPKPHHASTAVASRSATSVCILFVSSAAIVVGSWILQF